MLEYLNKSDSLEEYYQKMEYIEPVITYEYSKRRAKESLQEWKTKNVYRSINGITDKSVNNMNDMSAYFVTSWTFYSYMYG